MNSTTSVGVVIPPMPMTGIFTVRAGVVDHAQRDGFDGGAGEAGGYAGDSGAARFRVNRHRYECVHQRDGVGSRFLRHMRHLRDRGYVGGKFDDDGAGGGALGGAHDFVEQHGIAAKLNASVRRVGTRHVDFVGRDALALIQDFDGLLVVGAGVAEDVGEHDDVLFLAQRGELFGEEGGRSDVLQADGIQHSGGGFIEARRRISGHRFLGETFDDQSAEAVEVNDIFELDAVGEGAGGGDDRILEVDAGEADAQVGIGDGRHWVPPVGAAASLSKDDVAAQALLLALFRCLGRAR